jgi:hypothetical protein
MRALNLVIIVTVMLFAGATKAQVSVNVSVGAPPLWGPAGYTDVRYYYLPDVESYYDIQAAQFICLVDGNWLHRTYLPSPYKNYDLYAGYKVVIMDYNGSAPYKYFPDHKSKYAKGYRGPEQKNIGEKPGKGNSGEEKSGKGDQGNKDGGKDNGKGKKK